MLLVFSEVLIEFLLYFFTWPLIIFQDKSYNIPIFILWLLTLISVIALLIFYMKKSNKSKNKKNKK